MGKLLDLNTKAPGFTLTADNGKDVNLNDFRGEKNVVLVFYPKNNTPG